ncbi:FAD-binding oxidoreductase [Hoeflea olei]|uniref:FAD dependent oxidoreductase domain-containing protein n=1 Tax=Hoeflea olei TaxID=1480615 RepID=A0A1C1YSX8_9HYPH|nr:FAD-binding oxidoreductase [Hoeflea olei]OCW56594.1 hypothetical protein AWJ14_16765 [Hoeflea olei]
MPDHGVATSPSVLVTLGGASGRLSHVIEGGRLEIRSRGDGALISACDPGPSMDPASMNRLGDEVLARLRELFPDIGSPQIEEVRIAHRPMLAAGRPLVSAAPGMGNLLLAVAHPGVILAPEISRQVAALMAL